MTIKCNSWNIWIKCNLNLATTYSENIDYNKYKTT